MAPPNKRMADGLLRTRRVNRALSFVPARGSAPVRSALGAGWVVGLAIGLARVSFAGSQGLVSRVWRYSAAGGVA